MHKITATIGSSSKNSKGNQFLSSAPALITGCSGLPPLTSRSESSKLESDTLYANVVVVLLVVDICMTGGRMVVGGDLVGFGLPHLKSETLLHKVKKSSHCTMIGD